MKLPYPKGEVKVPPKGWRHVSLPEKLYNAVEQFIKEHPELGYQSVAEFVKDAIRRYLMHLGVAPSEREERG